MTDLLYEPKFQVITRYFFAYHIRSEGAGGKLRVNVPLMM